MWRDPRAYPSRVERGEVAPLAEETLVKLAHELGEDPDVLLAMAGKISTDLRAAILSRPQLFAELIRSIKSIPDQYRAAHRPGGSRRQLVKGDLVCEHDFSPATKGLGRRRKTGLAFLQGTGAR